MIERLRPVEDEERQEEIDEAIVHTESYEEAASAFATMTQHLDTEVSYSEGDMGGQYKRYRAETPSLVYRLSCNVNLDSPDSTVTCEIKVREKL